MTQGERIEWSLLSLRLGVFVVMFAWTIDKIVNPEHASKVYENFYFIGGMQDMIMHIIGVAELALIIAFLAGAWKRVTYGAVLILHGISTLSSWKQYTIDINLLFFAAWPMLAACIALYLLRDLDTKCTIESFPK